MHIDGRKCVGRPSGWWDFRGAQGIFCSETGNPFMSKEAASGCVNEAGETFAMYRIIYRKSRESR